MFYIYVYYNPFTQAPFYVGKGQKDRCMHHIWGMKNHYNVLLGAILRDLKKRKQRPIIKKPFESVDEQLIYAEEVRLIKQFGRLDLGTGILCNRSDGGEGWGNSGSTWSTEQRQKIITHRAANRRGRGIIQYDLFGRKIHEFLHPIEMRELGYTTVDIMAIRKCCRGLRFSVKGFKWGYIDEPAPITTKGIVVHQLNPNGELINIHPTIGLASKNTGINAGDIASCVRGEMCSAGNFLWISPNNPKLKLDEKRKKVIQLHDNGAQNIFESIINAANSLNIDPTNISKVCNKKGRVTAGGFKWKWCDE